jgi:hypothetical protein
MEGISRSLGSTGIHPCINVIKVEGYVKMMVMEILDRYLIRATYILKHTCASFFMFYEKQ